MTGKNEFFGSVNDLTGDALEPLLFNDNPTARCLGRFLASNMMKEVNQFLKDEADRGTENEIVFTVVSKVFSQTYASIIYPYLKPEKKTTFGAEYGVHVGKEVTTHFNRLDEMMAAGEIERVGRYGIRMKRK